MSITALQQTVRASESVNWPIDVGQRGQRALVEPDQRVAEVVVVEQDQVRPRLAGQLGHRRSARPATSTSTRCVRTSAPSAAVVQADRDVVRPQRRVLGRRLLQHRERGERARRRPTVNSLRSVFGPAVCSHAFDQSARLDAGAGLQRAQQVGQRRVAPAVLGEVGPDAGEEVVPADVGDQLLENRRALRVADAVEVRDSPRSASARRPRSGASTAAGPACSPRSCGRRRTWSRRR